MPLVMCATFGHSITAVPIRLSSHCSLPATGTHKHMQVGNTIRVCVHLSCACTCPHCECSIAGHAYAFSVQPTVQSMQDSDLVHWCGLCRSF